MRSPAGAVEDGAHRVAHVHDGLGEHGAALHGEVAVPVRLVSGTQRAFARAPAGDGDQLVSRAVAVQVEGEQGAGLGVLARAQHHGARAVAEDGAGGAVGRVEDGREGVRSNDEGAARAAGDDHRRGRGQCVDEAGAHGGHVEGSHGAEPEPVGDLRGCGRARLVGRAGGQDHQVDLRPGDVGARGGPPCRLQALRPASAARSDVARPGPAIRRRAMPVRVRIQSSEVSRSRASWSLSTTVGGTHAPRPHRTAALLTGRLLGCLLGCLLVTRRPRRPFR